MKIESVCGERATWRVSEWRGCYDARLKGLLSKEAHVHPAKMARGLTERIFDYGEAMGWWKKGDAILDPFSGVGTTLLVGAFRGYRVVGNELEKKFVDLFYGFDCDGTIQTHEETETEYRMRFVRGAETLEWAEVLDSAEEADELVERLGKTLLEYSAVASAEDGEPMPLPRELEQLLEWLGILADVRARGLERSENVGEVLATLFVDLLASGKVRAERVGYAVTKTAVDAPARCGKKVAHEAHHVVGSLELNERKLRMLGLPVPVMVQGDSRNLRAVLQMHAGEVIVPITSPAYAQSLDRSANEKPSRLSVEKANPVDYVSNPENLGNLPSGDFENAIQFVAANTSPPYAESVTYQRAGAGGEGNELLREGLTPQEIGTLRRAGDARVLETKRAAGYSRDENNIGNLPTGDLETAIQFVGAATSPAYSDIAAGAGGLNTKPAKDGQQGGRNPDSASQRANQRYGESDGQIAKLSEGDLGEVVGAITSPAYADARIGEASGAANVGHKQNYGNGDGQLGSMAEGDISTALQFAGAGTSPPYLPKTDRAVPWGHAHDGLQAEDVERGFAPVTTFRGSYGDDPANIGNPKGAAGVGDVEEVIAALTSPPWEKSVVETNGTQGAGTYAGTDLSKGMNRIKNDYMDYGSTDGQIGMLDTSTYWGAVARVYQEVFALLVDGGIFSVVVKDFVRDGKRVELCRQTIELLEAVGFEMVEEVHALMVEETRAVDLFGFEVVKGKERKSFFRRLGERTVAENNYWKTVDEQARAGFIAWASETLWAEYNALTMAEKRECLEDGVTLKHAPPTETDIRRAAVKRAFVASGERARDWNVDVRIDYETVIFARKGTR